MIACRKRPRPLPKNEIALIDGGSRKARSMTAGSKSPLAETRPLSLAPARSGKICEAHPGDRPRLLARMECNFLSLLRSHNLDVKRARWYGASGDCPSGSQSRRLAPENQPAAVTGGTPASMGTVALIDPASGFQPRLLCICRRCPSRQPSVRTAAARSRRWRFAPSGFLTRPSGGKQFRWCAARGLGAIGGLQSRMEPASSQPARDRTVRLTEVSTGEVRDDLRGPRNNGPGGRSFLADGRRVFTRAKQPSRDTSSGATKTEIIRAPGRPERLASIHSGWPIGSADGSSALSRQRSADALHPLRPQRCHHVHRLSRTPDVFATGVMRVSLHMESRVRHRGCSASWPSPR